MGKTQDLAVWLKNGCQRMAIAQVLRKPMTPQQICIAAREIAPRITRRDVSANLRQLEERGLSLCLTPSEVTGRLEFWTELGRRVVAICFGVRIDPLPEGVDWDRYAKIVRAPTRKIVLDEVAKERFYDEDAKTAAGIRKHLREKYSIAYKQVLRAVKELKELGLIEESGLTRKRGRKLYRITSQGALILKERER